MYEYADVLWKYRNSKVHGSNRDETRAIKIQKLHDKINDIYGRNNEHMGDEVRNQLKVPKENRMK